MYWFVRSVCTSRPVRDNMYLRTDATSVCTSVYDDKMSCYVHKYFTIYVIMYTSYTVTYDYNTYYVCVNILIPRLSDDKANSKRHSMIFNSHGIHKYYLNCLYYSVLKTEYYIVSYITVYGWGVETFARSLTGRGDSRFSPSSRHDIGQ